MPQEQIKLRGKFLYLHKAISSPDFNSPNVLTRDPWSYVDLWLRRNCSGARLFWEQAKQFYVATRGLNFIAAPLTMYYCVLNATKALLIVKGKQFTDQHGVYGGNSAESTSLNDEKVHIQNKGICSALSLYLEDKTDVTYSLKEIFYNLPYIHRAYTLTYPSESELFYPLKYPRYVFKSGSTEGWFCANIEGAQYQSDHIVNSIGPSYERDLGLSEENWTIRKKTGRFRWDESDIDASLEELGRYHAKIRRDVVYIYGSTRLWYIKNFKAQGRLNDHTLPLMFAAVHRLSELSRYSPSLLERHLSCDHNWLLQEFISLTLDQYVDEISSEITGQDLMTVGLRAQ